MRKQGWLYAIILLGFIGLGLLGRKPIDWKVTYDPDDENPFGSHALHQLLPNFLSDGDTKGSIETLFRSFDEAQQEGISGNQLVVCDFFTPDSRELKALLDYVRKGNTVVIAANGLGGAIDDSLGISSFRHNALEIIVEEGEYKPIIDIDFKRGKGFPKRTFTFPLEASPSYLIDSTENFTPLAYTFEEQPVLIGARMGEGQLYFSTTPMLFTNYYLLRHQGYKFVSGILSPLANSGHLIYNQFHQFGRLESPSPFRYILKQPALRAAYIVTILAMLLFIIFYGKRVQRIIPIIRPLRNSSLDFANTLGQLYYKQRDHKNLAEKRLRYWLNYVHTHYRINVNQLDEAFVRDVQARSGVAEKTVKALTGLANFQGKNKIWSTEDMLYLERQLHQFYITKDRDNDGRRE